MSEVLTSSASGDRPTERSDSFIDDDADFVKLFVGQASSTIRKDSKLISFTVSFVTLFSYLMLTQIPKDMNEELLLPFFSEFGPVAELTVIRDKINQTHKGALLRMAMFMMRRNLSINRTMLIVILHFAEHRMCFLNILHATISTESS